MVYKEKNAWFSGQEKVQGTLTKLVNLVLQEIAQVLQERFDNVFDHFTSFGYCRRGNNLAVETPAIINTLSKIDSECILYYWADHVGSILNPLSFEINHCSTKPQGNVLSLPINAFSLNGSKTFLQARCNGL